MHTVRPLYTWEIREARRVFANQLNYDPIRVHENASLPDAINRVSLWLRRMPYTRTPNAISLGNHCYFPIKLLEAPVSPDHKEHSKIGWLIHELTHAWQYQRLGWRYLSMALDVQFRKGGGIYDFGGESGLVESYSAGRRLADYNLEQQGDIARTYYDSLVRGRNVIAWQPFIQEFQGKEPA
jgi:hypothetical protein